MTARQTTVPAVMMQETETPAPEAPALTAPVPTFSGNQMRQALAAYQTLQRTLDEAMPDQIIRIDDRAFRKKGYWPSV
jgi:hypothetical protein